MAKVQTLKPYWERGFRCWGYWLGTQRIGFVGLPPRPSKVGQSGYSWSFDMPKVDEVEGRASNLAGAKRLVEDAYEDWINGPWRRLALDLARHIENPDSIPVTRWGLVAIELLRRVKQLDANAYLNEVAKPTAKPTPKRK